jgi:serine/threonine protein kinase
VAARYPNREAEVLAALDGIDEELQREWPVLPSATRAASRRPRPLPAQPDRDPRAPLSSLDYRLQSHLGSGGIGRVYRAWQRSLDRPVAIKALRKAFWRNHAAVDRFLDEGRVLARFRHSGIVAVHGAGRFPNGGYFIAMDLLSGPGLDSVVGGATIAPVQAARWIGEAAGAVAHAHQHGVVHCDLKPANLLLDDGRIVVTDFGLARRLGIAERGLGEIAGTAPFMAPEQVDEHWGAIGPGTDVYGLGATLYALLAGRPPHDGTIPDILTLVASGVAPASLLALRPRVPKSLVAICEHCLAPRSADRPASAMELAEELARFFDVH